MNGEAVRWYSVRCVFKMRMGPSWRRREDGLHEYEERITLWHSDSFDSAIASAEAEAREYLEALEVEYLGVAQAFALDDDIETLGDGAEIFSSLRASSLTPEEYVSRYIETPSHRHTQRYEHKVQGKAESVFARRQLALAEEAVAAVLDDLHRTTTARPEAAVDVLDEHVIRISVNGGFTTPSMWAVEPSHALVEVAGYIQEQLDQDLGCWPICSTHGFGLHAEVHDGAAVWWCRPGAHGVAPIGQLAQSS